MLHALQQHLLSPRSSRVVSPGTAYGDSQWSDCGLHIDDILTNNVVYNGITKDLIENNYTWYGAVPGLDGAYQRNDTLFLTYEGCKAICGSGTISWNTRQQGLNIAATWVFPLAILINLPFERAIWATISNWLGSPQTALTASIWNFWQTRQCHLQAIGRSGIVDEVQGIWNSLLAWAGGRSTPEMNDEERARIRTRTNAFYVLSCFNQFDLGLNTTHDKKGERLRHEENLKALLSTLVYGLFRPLSEPQEDGQNGIAIDGLSNDAVAGPQQSAVNAQNRDQGPPRQEDCDENIQLTTALLSVLARQLRINRRRGMIPTLLSLLTFYLAFAFSIVLAFSDLSDSTSIFVLDIGIFFSWVPILVVSFLLDRNPGDSKHQGKLMARWLYNINAVRERDGAARISWWSGDKVSRRGGSDGDEISNNEPETNHNNSGVKNDDPGETDSLTSNTDGPTADDEHGKALKPFPECPDPYDVGDFIGQGRTLSYCGLVSAILVETQKEGIFGNWDKETLDELSSKILERLQHKRPWSWLTTSLVCLAIVWTQILMAFTSDFITPTLGPGCWSMGFLIYGCFSTVTWILQFWPLNKRRHWLVRRSLTWTSHFFNALAVTYILLILFVFSSGILNNCYCNSVMGGIAGWGGYVDFRSFEFYRDKYNLTRWWIACAVSASSVSIMSLAITVIWWWECRPLWADQEGTREGLELIDMQWLH